MPALGRPLARLLALGALLAAARALGPQAHEPRAPETGRFVDQALRGVVSGTPGARAPRSALDDEALYREALAVLATERDPVVRRRLRALARQVELDADPGDAAGAAHELGFARSDAVVRRYLIELSRLALGGAPGDHVPSEDELAGFHAAHAERFTTPARVRLTHVYLSTARRGAALEDDAARLLAEIRAGDLAPEEAARLGDPFLRGARLAGSEAEIARVLGGEVASAALAAPPGTWLGPLRSPYGLHLVRVAERTPATLAPLDAVRGRVAHALLRERGEARRRARMELLRERYGIGAAAGAAGGRAAAPARASS